MRIKVYELIMVEPCKWGGDITPYIRIELELNIKEGFFFVVSVADKSFCFRNPITALVKALECETVSASKYVRLKGLRPNVLAAMEREANATPLEFRNELLRLALKAHNEKVNSAGGDLSASPVEPKA